MPEQNASRMATCCICGAHPRSVERMAPNNFLQSRRKTRCGLGLAIFPSLPPEVATSLSPAYFVHGPVPVEMHVISETSPRLGPFTCTLPGPVWGYLPVRSRDFAAAAACPPARRSRCLFSGNSASLLAPGHRLWSQILEILWGVIKLELCPKGQMLFRWNLFSRHVNPSPHGATRY